MIPEWFQKSLRHFATTIFDTGKLKPKYLFKKLFILWKSRIFIQNKYSFLKNPESSFKQIFIFLKSRIFIQKKYSFFQNSEFSLKRNIHFFKRGLIGQGFWVVANWLHTRIGNWVSKRPSGTKIFAGQETVSRKQFVFKFNMPKGDSWSWGQSKHLKGQLWPGVSDVFAYYCPEVNCYPVLVTFLLIPAQRLVVTPRQSELSAGGTKRGVENTQKCTRPNCILTWQSSLGPPPVGLRWT